MLIETKKSIYVFEYLGRYKIGMSNNINRRLSQLSCGCPGIKCIYCSKLLSNFNKMERMLHKLFWEWNVGGEWFSCIDIKRIESIIEKYGISNIVISSNNKKQWDYAPLMEKFFPKDEDDDELQKVKQENIELDKFLQSLNGSDIPNIYSDLIYDVLFGESTEQLRKKFDTKRFESFRKHLTDEQNKQIDDYTLIVVGLINLYKDFDYIKDFLYNVF